MGLLEIHYKPEEFSCFYGLTQELLVLIDLLFIIRQYIYKKRLIQSV